jgi:hypothetical protein
MSKKEFKKGFISATVVLALLLLMFIHIDAINAGVPSQPHPANAIWLEPSELNCTGQVVGYKFNVTAWTNASASVFTWQVNITFNPAHVNAIRAGYTKVAKSEFFENLTSTIPMAPVIDNILGYVLHGESGIWPSVRDPGYGSLFWAEFEIVAVPPQGTTWSSVLNITNVDTYLLNPDLEELPGMNKYNAAYSYTSPLDTTPPTLGTPTQVPPSNVQPDQEVKVSVNVTDTESGVKNVTLSYRIEPETTWNNVSMIWNSTSGLWDGVIPGKPIDTVVKYMITAFDNAENEAVNNNAGDYFVYTVVPEFTVTMLLIIMVIVTIAVVGVRKKFPKLK